jgi:hypothetical protein
MRKFLTAFWFMLMPVIGIFAQGLREIPWEMPLAGLEVARIPYAFDIICGDSTIGLIRIHRDSARLHLFSTSILGGQSMSADEWARKMDVQIVFNAGMYIPGTMLSKGQMKAGNQWNQKESLSSFGGIFLLEGAAGKSFDLKDKFCSDDKASSGNYPSFFECMRLLDCRGAALSWKKKKQQCSMLVAAEDTTGNLILAFCRSPMTQSAMADFLSGLPIGLRTALYLEGGPETSIYFNFPGIEPAKWLGTFVSDTWEKTDNQVFRKLPNVIGIKFSSVRK